MRRILPLLLIFATVACGKAGVDPSSRKDTVAVAGAFYVTDSDLRREALAVGEDVSDPVILSRILDSLVEEALLLNGLASPDQEGRPRPLSDFGDGARRREAVSILLEEKVYSKIEVGHEEVEAYYRDNKDKYVRGEGFLIRQVTVGGGRLKDEAYTLLKKGYSFEEVARLYSISPDKGKPQYFERGEVPEYLLPKLTLLPEGSFTEPMEISRDTFQIIMVVKKEKSYLLPIDMVRQIIRLNLSDLKGERLRKDFIKSLEKSYNVHLFTDRLYFKYVKENE